jgi:hypothetical protein
MQRVSSASASFPAPHRGRREAPRSPGATTENVEQYSMEEQRRGQGCIAGRMPPRCSRALLERGDPLHGCTVRLYRRSPVSMLMRVAPAGPPGSPRRPRRADFARWGGEASHVTRVRGAEDELGIPGDSLGEGGNRRGINTGELWD